MWNLLWGGKSLVRKSQVKQFPSSQIVIRVQQQTAPLRGLVRKLHGKKETDSQTSLGGFPPGMASRAHPGRQEACVGRGHWSSPDHMMPGKSAVFSLKILNNLQLQIAMIKITTSKPPCSWARILVLGKMWGNHGYWEPRIDGTKHITWVCLKVGCPKIC